MAEISLTGDQMLTVLETVARQGPLSAADVARLCDINRTVAHRLLVTLAQRAYVRRDEEGYRVGPAALLLAQSADFDLRRLARPIMQRLAEDTGETVVMHAIDDAEAVVIDQALAQRHLVRVEHRPGSRHPLHQGASGWSLLAFQSGKFIDRVLKIDDPVGAVSVHGVSGAWGTISYAFFRLGGFDMKVLMAQVVGVAVAFVWAFGCALILFLIIKYTIGLRVSREEELRGLDIPEHGMEAYSGFQIFTSV